MSQQRTTTTTSSTEEKGYIDSAIDAASSAAASVGNAATSLKDKVTHMGSAATEKTKEGEAAANKEANKQTTKDPNAGITDRIKAAGGVVSNTVDEKAHGAEYEKEKKQATS
jgi:hypothetical protein